MREEVSMVDILAVSVISHGSIKNKGGGGAGDETHRLSLLPH